MVRGKHEVLVRKEDQAAIEAVRAVVLKINGYATPEYSNDTHVRFEYFGSMLQGVECMGAGASMVS